MSEQTFNTRIILKHDIEAHWNLAAGFVPKKGEIIIYDADEFHTYNRIKIGDGVRPVSVNQDSYHVDALPFYSANEVHWDDVEGKPFVTVGESDTLEWDGNTEGLVCVGGMLYKVSDATPTMDNLSNGAVMTMSSGEGGELAGGDDIYQLGDIIIVGNAVIALTDNATYEFLGTFPKKGTYFLMLEGDMFMSKLTIPGYTGFETEKLDPKVLPEHEHMWDDISDRPFYAEEPVTTTEVTLEETTYDGFENGNYQIAGTRNFVEGAECIVTWDGVEYTTTVVKTEDVGMTVFELGNPVLAGHEGAEDNGQPFAIGYLEELQLLTFIASDTETTSHTVKIVSNITTQTIHKLDNKYLDTEWVAKAPTYETVLTVAETTITATATDNGYVYIGVLAADTSDIVEGSVVTIELDGVEYIAKVTDINGGLMFGNIYGYFFGIFSIGAPYCGIVTDNGIVFFFATEGDHAVALSVDAPIYDQLPGEYIGEHTHNYAGSSSAGGAATSADKLNTNAGSATQPVYFSEGKPVATTYTLGKSVPSDAVFTDTDTKVTSVGNHYTPTADSNSALSVDAKSATSTASWGTTNLVTGVNLQRDAKGHVTGVTVDSIKMPANPNTTPVTSVNNKTGAVSLSASDVGALASSLKGTANGLAELDASGKVPSLQLPSYVDDVIEGTYASETSFKNTSGTAVIGETSKIYVDTSTNKTYRWSGSKFVEISASLALGTTSSTAFRGDQGKTAYDHSQSAHAPSNAEKNQNAFSNVKVGSTTVAADTTTDTLELVGSNVTLTPDATNDKITIGITKDNVTSALGYTPPTTNTTYGVVSTTADGLAPKRDGSTTKFLRGDGTWAVPPDTNTTYTNASLGNGYGTCSTAAATTAKVVTLSGYALSTGGQVSVKFTNAVPAGATMNINSKGAKAIWYKGKAITDGIICAGEVATFIYDGTRYHLLTVDRNRFFTSLVPMGTAIPENADLNTLEYLKVGNYYCSSNATTKTLLNCPTVTTASDGTKSGTAFMMTVSSPLSQTVDDESGTWKYRFRTIQAYNGPMYTQYCYSNGTAGNWIYGTWYQVIKSNDTATSSRNGIMTAADKVKVDNSVLHSAQTLTDAQKTQARANIGAVQTWGELSGKPVSGGSDTLVWNGIPGDLYSVPTTFFGSLPATLYKVSDLIPSYESFLRGFSYSTVTDGKVNVYTLSADEVEEANALTFSYAEDGSRLDISLGLITVLYTEYTDPDNGSVMTPGVYFMELESGGPRSLQINGYSGFSSEYFDDSLIPYTVSRVGHTHRNATQDLSGFISPDDKAKLDSIPSNVAPLYSYGTGDLTPGTSPLTTGKLHFVYE